jgi:P4 family phage/plasmid primase-like protien
MITQSTIVSIGKGEPVLWLKFLHDATGGNPEYVGLIQRVLGYCLTGDVSEHALFFIHGDGGTGKSTLVRVVQEILGTYAWTAPMSMFAARPYEGHPNELAELRGRRFVTATETEQGRAWAEARIKQLTGGDEIAARFMRQEWFKFKPTHKLVIIGNHARVSSPRVTTCGAAFTCCRSSTSRKRSTGTCTQSSCLRLPAYSAG